MSKIDNENEMLKKKCILVLRSWVSSRTKSTEYNLSIEELKFFGYDKFM